MTESDRIEILLKKIGTLIPCYVKNILKNFFLKKVIIWVVTSRIGSIIGEKSKKNTIFFFLINLISCTHFSVNGSLKDNKNVHKGLKIRIFFKN